MRRLWMALLLGAMALPAAAEETIASPAVRLLDLGIASAPEARAGWRADVLHWHAPSGQGEQISGSGSFPIGIQATFAHAWTPLNYAFRIEARAQDGQLVASEHLPATDYERWIYEDEQLEDGGQATYHSSLSLWGDGFYTIRVQLQDSQGNTLDTSTEDVYFLQGSDIFLGGGTARAWEKIRTPHEMCWLPILDWEAHRVRSRSYRVRIYDPKFGEKGHEAPNVFQTTVTEPRVSVDGRLLPKGEYTVWVECLDAGGAVLRTIKTALKVGTQRVRYSYDLGEYVEIEPGQSLTRTHVPGSKDMTRYGTVNPEPIEGYMTTLTLQGGETLDVRCGGARFRAAREGDALVLLGASDDWRISRRALDVLNQSGVAQIIVQRAEGTRLSLPTDTALSGRIYGQLRAQGLVSRDFVFLLREDAWAVEVQGAVYALLEGELIPITEETP